ncbi:hypothetical protein FA95DRAFT_1555319 [Auriscalpium vulgare]|uniref:Uncharacterized protein n=1 Tax=Auriscalpium vulgare TaxID=40419 RepID=A0ACB8S4L0_9AGAM|nr:hypothetical protein FA95DRAFT_1555319 [Auriscalpium vulgare]
MLGFRSRRDHSRLVALVRDSDHVVLSQRAVLLSLLSLLMLSRLIEDYSPNPLAIFRTSQTIAVRERCVTDGESRTFVWIQKPISSMTERYRGI